MSYDQWLWSRAEEFTFGSGKDDDGCDEDCDSCDDCDCPDNPNYKEEQCRTDLGSEFGTLKTKK